MLKTGRTGHEDRRYLDHRVGAAVATRNYNVYTVCEKVIQDTSSRSFQFMKAKIVRIGNSRGIRLPKTVLHHCGFEDTVELDVQDNRVIIRPAHQPRSEWDKVFSAMAARGDDQLLDADTDLATQWDRAEWRW
jgi:antitoxin MazE